MRSGLVCACAPGGALRASQAALSPREWRFGADFCRGSVRIVPWQRGEAWRGAGGAARSRLPVKRVRAGVRMACAETYPVISALGGGLRRAEMQTWLPQRSGTAVSSRAEAGPLNMLKDPFEKMYG